MELELRTSKQQASGSVDVSDATFGAAFREPLVHQVVTAYQAGGRAGTKAQKTRAEVRGGGAKPWRQKGTGKARAGTIRSPIWIGGGQHFPAKPRDFSQKVNRKMYRGALRSILSEMARQGRLHVVEDFAASAPKTSEVASKLAAFGAADALIVRAEVDENLALGARNIPQVSVAEAQRLDPVTLLRHDDVIMTVDAIRRVEEWLG
jgi:large subunit ribosomal protein L4